VEEALKFLSHLDLMRLFHRTVRRSGLPMAYSQGFNPHPRLNIAVPLPVGITAGREYGEVFFREPVRVEDFLQAVSKQLPEGLLLTGANEAKSDGPSLSAVINAARYDACWAGPASALREEALPQLLSELMWREEIFVERRAKSGQTVLVNIRPFIIAASPLGQGGGSVGLTLLLHLGSKGGASPFAVLRQLTGEASGAGENLWHLHRQGLYIYDQGTLKAPFDLGGEVIDGQKDSGKL